MGPTSHDVVAAVRRAIGVQRVGHTGTLDPFASGLLLILVGRATRLAQYLVGLAKRYTGVITLGTTTNSCDRTGEVTQTSDLWKTLTSQDVERVIAGLNGPQRQRPPALSAKKIGGQRAYKLARQGKSPEIPYQQVDIFSFTMTAMRGEQVEFDALVSSGTYIRSLGRDLGEQLGCGAHLAELRRTAVGPFEIRDAVEVDDTLTLDRLRPAREVVAHLPTVPLEGAQRQSVCHGRPITTPEAFSGTVALVDGNELVAVAEADGTQIQPKVVLAG